MRFVNFVYELLDRNAPMDDQEKRDLRADANIWYGDQKKQILLDDGIRVKDWKSLTNWKQKIVWIAEQWYTRTLFAILFIWLSRAIQEYMNPYEDEDDDDRDHDE